MKQKKKLIVSVGTSAYNEEQNILNMLRSVCSQKEEDIEIKEIIVISDGSKDSTVMRAKSIKDKRIKVINDGKRLGQPSRVAQLLKMFKGDVFVLIDSDMVMKDTKTIHYLVSKFKKNKKIGLVCGEILPIKGKTFLERAINNYRYARADLEKKGIYNFGKTAYCAHAFLAYSKKFARSLVIPPKVINADAYSYFRCITSGFTQSYEKRAIVLYRSPQTIKDHINQSNRHIVGGLQLYNYFGKKMVDKEFGLPKNVLTKLMFIQIKKNLFGYIVLKMLNLYCMYLSRRQKNNLNPRWTTIESSKLVF